MRHGVFVYEVVGRGGGKVADVGGKSVCVRVRVCDPRMVCVCMCVSVSTPIGCTTFRTQPRRYSTSCLCVFASDCACQCASVCAAC